MRPNEKLDDRDVRDVQPALAATSTRSTSAIIAAGVISLVSVSLAVAALAVAVAATDKAVAAAPSYRLLFMSCQFAPTPNATAGGIQHGNKDSHGQPVDLAFAWETMADTQPDALISLGDFVYAEYSFEPLDGEWLRYNVLDASDPDEGIKEKCAEKNSTAHNHKCLDGAAFLAYMNRSLVEKLQLVASLPGYQRIRDKAAIYTVWDDHDLGLNDWDRSYHFKFPLAETFKNFFPKDTAWDPGLKARDGIYQSYTIDVEGQAVQLLLLDDQFFRSPASAAGERVASVYGEAQWAFIREKLSEHADLRIIAQGSTFFGQVFKDDALPVYPFEQLRFFNLLEELQVSRCVFLSGDIHLAAAARRRGVTPFPLYEFVTSGLTHYGRPKTGAKGAVGTFTDNLFVKAAFNFGTLDLFLAGDAPSLAFTAVAIDYAARNSSVAFRVEVPLAEITRTATWDLPKIQPAPSPRYLTLQINVSSLLDAGDGGRHTVSEVRMLYGGRRLLMHAVSGEAAKYERSLPTDGLFFGDQIELRFVVDIMAAKMTSDPMALIVAPRTVDANDAAGWFTFECDWVAAACT